MRIFWMLVLSGCAATKPMVWVNSGTSHNFKTDYYECERDARVTVPTGRGLLSSVSVHVDEDFMGRCMWSKGWTEVEKGSTRKPKVSQPASPL